MYKMQNAVYVEFKATGKILIHEGRKKEKKKMKEGKKKELLRGKQIRSYMICTNHETKEVAQIFTVQFCFHFNYICVVK